MSETTPLLYVNGMLVPEGDARVSALDRGFTLADGVFETMVASGDRVFRLRDHLARLRQGATVLRLPLPSAKALADAVRETLRRNDCPWSVARLTVSRGTDPGRGLDVPRGLTPTVVVRTTPWPGPPAALPPGRRLALSPISRNDLSPLSRVKSLAYVEGVMARQEARRHGDDDAVLCNTRGFVACASSSNLFVVLDGVAVTPPVEDGVLPGVARRTVLAEARRLGIATQERSLLVEELARADDVFLTNVVTGPLPVVSLGGRPIGRGVPGRVVTRLARAYWECVARRLD